MLRRTRQAIRLLVEQERLLAIAISTVLVMAGQGIVAPVLPLYAKSFGVGAATVGLTLTFFALARLVLNVPLGVLADRRGRRVLLVSGPLVSALGMLGSGLAPSIVALLLWRLVAGAGSAMYMTGAQIYLADISTAENRARFIGTNQGALLLGVSVGPAIGGFVAEGFGFRAPFYVVAVAALVAGVYALVRLPETRPEVEHAAADGDEAELPGRPWVRFVRSPDFVAVALVTFAIFFTRTAGRMTLVPLKADTELAMSPGTLGIFFTAMAALTMAGLAPAAMIADRFGRKVAIVPSGLVVAAGLAALGVAGDTGVFVAAGLLMSAGSSIAGPAPAAYVADIAPDRLRGLAMALYRTAGDAGFVLGPPLLGALADMTSIAWGLGANAVLMATSALVFALVAKETLGRATPVVHGPDAPAVAD